MEVEMLRVVIAVYVLEVESNLPADGLEVTGGGGEKKVGIRTSSWTVVEMVTPLTKMAKKMKSKQAGEWEPETEDWNQEHWPCYVSDAYLTYMNIRII